HARPLTTPALQVVFAAAAAAGPGALAVLHPLRHLARFHLVDHLVPVVAQILAERLAHLARPAGDALGVVLVHVAQVVHVGQVVELALFAAGHRDPRDEPLQARGCAAGAARRRRLGGGEGLVVVAGAPSAGSAAVLVDRH